MKKDCSCDDAQRYYPSKYFFFHVDAHLGFICQCYDVTRNIYIFLERLKLKIILFAKCVFVLA